MYKLYHGDCITVMREHIADNSIDLTVTSPPYDNLRDYGKDFDAATFDWHSIIQELYRVTAVGGVVVWVVADATIKGSETGTSFRQALFAIECGFRLHDTMIYQTDKPPMTHNRYQACFEYMFVWSKGKPKTFNPIMIKSKHGGKKRIDKTYRQKDGDLTPQHRGGVYNNLTVLTSIWKIGNNNQSAIQHPATFPEQLANDHIISWSNPGDTVLDPMFGSCRTGKMALKNGRNFMGIELDAGYFALGEVTVKNAAGDYQLTQREHDSGKRSLFGW